MNPRGISQMDGGSGMKKLTIGLISLLLLALAIGAVGCTGDDTRMPEDVVPLSVAGFILESRDDYILPQLEGEEYSAAASFLPLVNSEFADTVEFLFIGVHLFDDDVSAEVVVVMLTQGKTHATMEGNIEGNNVRYFVIYDGDSGEAVAIEQQGRLVIVSTTMPPFEALIFDRDALCDAAVRGLEATRL